MFILSSTSSAHIAYYVSHNKGISSSIKCHRGLSITYKWILELLAYSLAHIHMHRYEQTHLNNEYWNIGCNATFLKQWEKEQKQFMLLFFVKDSNLKKNCSFCQFQNIRFHFFANIWKSRFFEILMRKINYSNVFNISLFFDWSNTLNHTNLNVRQK